MPKVKMNEIISNQLDQTSVSEQSKLLEIVYYTDPLCCWSWAFEPQWRKFLYLHRDSIHVRYCMTGLLPGWQNYFDSINDVSKPIHMAPLWMQAQEISGMPYDPAIWTRDPPSSSYPSCIAVKSAFMQSATSGELYLRAVRQAVMKDGLNITKKRVLLSLAEDLSLKFSVFDFSRFKNDLGSETSIEAFRQDLQETQYFKISRFPSLLVSHNQKTLLISGYHPYHQVLAAVNHLANLGETDKPIDLSEFKACWPLITEREIEEIKNNINGVDVFNRNSL